jgi:hypothetical protein
MPQTNRNKLRMKPIRLNLDPYRGEWVALDPKTNRVVSHNTSLKAAEEAAVRRGVRRPLMMPVPESDAYFVGINT